VARQTYSETFAHLNTAEDMAEYLDTAYGTRQLAKELQEPHSRFYFLEENGQVAGFLKLNEGPAQTDVHDDDALEVQKIYLLAAFQRRGFGRVLMEEAMRVGRALGKTYLWLGVWEHNHKALAFYKSHGFRRFGAHPYVLGSDVQTDLLLRKDL
jgi:ribosomal protein S18 acetylase RimI-like enzyme